jgi:hypothetical protein
MGNWDAVMARVRQKRLARARAGLPASVEEIAEVIGRERALYLIGKLPRCRPPSGEGRTQVILYVPKTITPDHRLVQILGQEDAERLVEAFGGEILKPGTCRQIYRVYRDQGIVRAVNDGVPTAMVAAWFGLSSRHVLNVLEKAQEDRSARSRRDSGEC